MEPEDEDGWESSEAVVGFPNFEHGQWTVEGEIERLGAFGRAGARANGWRRTVAITIVVAMVAPLVVGTVRVIQIVASGHHGLPAASATDLTGSVRNATCDDVRADPAFADVTQLLQTIDVGGQLGCELAVSTGTAVAVRLGIPKSCAAATIPVLVTLDKASRRWGVRPSDVAPTAAATCNAR